LHIGLATLCRTYLNGEACLRNIGSTWKDLTAKPVQEASAKRLNLDCSSRFIRG
jgi:hypothetical protein